MIVNILSQELRQLSVMRQAVDTGQNINGVLQQQRIWFNRKQAVSQALQRLTLQELSALLSIAWEVDQSVKGMALGNPWNSLADICLRMASGTSALALSTSQR